MYKKNYQVSFLFICIFLFSQTLSYSQTKTEQFDKVLNIYHDYGLFNGSVLIAEKGEIIYKKGFGMANMEWEIPNEPNTKHRLGSITKQFTAMLILQLAENGILDLHTPISTYLPKYPKENGDKITLHHLLTHSSGIPNYTSFPDFFQNQSRNPYSPDEFVELFAHKELDFAPGERYNYSNSGYFLLGVIAEKISGKTYEELLQENIFLPTGMNNSGYDNHSDILKNRATGYEKNGNGYVNSNYLDMSIPYAAGSLYSTVEDLYLWDQTLNTNKLLSQEMMNLYVTPHISTQGESHYAYGWSISKEKIGNTDQTIDVIEHGGGINGFNTYISRATSDKSLIVLLNNTGGAPLAQITSAIRGIMYGETYDLPKQSISKSVSEMIEERGIEAAISHFNKIKGDDNYELIERDINNLGYQLMADKRVKEALQIFKLNVDQFPTSFNVYDSYAEAHMNLGNNEKAIENYKKSIELNPANTQGIAMLKKLGADVSTYEKEIIVPENILESYLGQYELFPNFSITITKEGSQLIAQATGQPQFEISPKSNRDFYLKAVNAQISFNTNNNGTVESLTLFQGGQEMVGKKI